MSQFVIADTHLDHANILKHVPKRAKKYMTAQDYSVLQKILENGSKRDFKKFTPTKKSLQNMNEGIVDIWNSTVGNKDLVYIVGDFAMRNHRKWISILNGSKILIRGSHDKMPLLSEQQFSEIHDVLNRKICGKRVFMFHCPCVSWEGMYRGVIHLHGHSHGRVRSKRGFLMKDVGWDVLKRPWSFEELYMKLGD